LKKLAIAPRAEAAQGRTRTTDSPYGALDDARLEKLAREWREWAQQGDPIAPGIAAAFEAEVRRRQQEADAAKAQEMGPASRRRWPRRAWWKFW